MNKKISTVIYILLALAGIITALYFGSAKKGFYIDEYYTYTLANGDDLLGIAVKNEGWSSTDGIVSQLIPDESVRFDLGRVYSRAAQNVHPPLYYYLIHISSSLHTQDFTKWTGLLVNLLLWIICLFPARGISREISGGNETLALISFGAYCISPAILSGLMLIRMYVPFHLFTMLYAWLLLRDMKESRIRVGGFLLPVFITGFLGFMTQYYFVIIMFFMTFFYMAFLVTDALRGGRQSRLSLIRPAAFGLTALLSLVASYFYWPVSIFHIFKGYRGKASFGALSKAADLLDRLKLFFGNLNENMFGGLIIIPVIALAAGVFFLVKKGRGGLFEVRERGFLVLALSSACYFLVVAKIGLKAAYASGRYEYPVYGLFIILSAAGIYTVAHRFISSGAGAAVTLALMAVMSVTAFARGQVLYTYPEEEILESFAASHPESEMVVFNRGDEKVDTRLKDYIKKDRIYWADSRQSGRIDDELIKGAGSLLVYVDARDDVQACLARLTGDEERSVDMQQVFTTPGGDFEIWYLSRQRK
jgi:hypothetical protein